MSIFVYENKRVYENEFITINDISYPVKDIYFRERLGVLTLPDQIRPQPEENYDITLDTNGFEVYSIKSQAVIDQQINNKIQQQIEALERAEMNPRDTRETKISYAEFIATSMGAAASSTFTLPQFNQVISALGIALTPEQQTSVTSGVVPPLTPTQSIEIAYATNIAYRKNIDFDNQIKALRAQLI